MFMFKSRLFPIMLSLAVLMSSVPAGAEEPARIVQAEGEVSSVIEEEGKVLSDNGIVSGNVIDRMSYSGKQSTVFKGSDGKYYAVKGSKLLLGAGTKSSDKKAFKVKKNGLVKVGKSGSATLETGKFGTIDVSIITPKISEKKAALTVGGSKQLSLSGVPEGVPVAWISSDQSIVQVMSGNCIAVGIGKAKVFAYVGGKALKCGITVKDAAGSTLLVNAGSKPKKINGLKKPKKLTLTTSDDSISYKGGKISAPSSKKNPVTGELSDGHKLLIYSNDEGTESASFTLKTGEKAFVLKDNMHEMPDFKSKKPEIASVSEYGIITGNGEGKTVITGKAGGKKIKITVTVTGEVDDRAPSGVPFRKYRITDPINGNKGNSIIFSETCDIISVISETGIENGESGEKGGPDDPEEPLDPNAPGVVSYSVDYRLMNLDGKTYTIDSTETFYAKKGTEVTPKVKTYEGFTSPKSKTVTVTGKGLKIEYNYIRNKYHAEALAGENISYVTGTGDYYFGAEVTLTATPKPGTGDGDYVTEGSYRYKNGMVYTFNKWSDGTTQAKKVFNMPAKDVSFTAAASGKQGKIEEYLLTLTAGDGINSVKGGGWYAPGSEAAISAKVETGHFISDEYQYNEEQNYRFKAGFTYGSLRWSDGSTENERTVTVNGAMTLTATGTKAYDADKQDEEYKLTLRAGENITNVYGDDLSPGKTVEKWMKKEHGITIRATVSGNYTETDFVYNGADEASSDHRYKNRHTYSFVKWSDGTRTITNKDYSLAMDRPYDLTATASHTESITEEQYKLTITKDDGVSRAYATPTGPWYKTIESPNIIAGAKDGYIIISGIGSAGKMTSAKTVHVKSMPADIDARSVAFTSDSDFKLSTIEKTWNGKIYYKIMTYSEGTTDWIEWHGEELAGTNTTIIYLRGVSNNIITGGKPWTFTGKYCSGNVENLLDQETVTNGGHPAMAANCFFRMFSGCSSLKSAPLLSADTLSNNCYMNMFSGCTSLREAPLLPATTLAIGCYRGMFEGCTALTSAPQLPALTLAEGCYLRMFRGCSSLKFSTTNTNLYKYSYRIPVSGTGVAADNALTGMFAGTEGYFADKTGTPDINTTYYTDHEPVSELSTSALKFSSDGAFTLSAIKGWNYMEYSTDNGNTWNEWSGSQLSGNATKPIYLRGTGNNKVVSLPSGTGGSPWSFTGNYCTGNIDNLLDYVTVAKGGHPTMARYAFSNMFKGNQTLKIAPTFPVRQLYEGCYYGMFDESSLTIAPELPATILATSCYEVMFDRSSISTIPELPATSLPSKCYNMMFFDSPSVMCSGTSPSGECQHEYRIPSSGTITSAPYDSVENMFAYTIGYFYTPYTEFYPEDTHRVEFNKTYYINHEPVG